MQVVTDETPAGSLDPVLYSIGLDTDRKLRVAMRFPFDINDWALGNSAVTEGPKLQRYDQMYGERERVTGLIRLQLQPVKEDCFRVMREIDANLGLNRVEAGLRRAERLARQG